MVGWGSSSAQGETAVAPIFDSGTLRVTCFLALFCCLGLGLRPGSVLPHLFFFPTHRLPFLWGCFFFPPSRGDATWRHGAHAPRARACGSFAGGALFWAFFHILLYYCSDYARSALETGRPATSGNPMNLEGCWFCGCVCGCVYESAAQPETQTRDTRVAGIAARIQHKRNGRK